ncbi:hypothetical protein PENTCL1PPCAC_29724, partial [Pristionchus entomophagus]
TSIRGRRVDFSSLQCSSDRSSSSSSSRFWQLTPWPAGRQRRQCATRWCASANEPLLPTTPPRPLLPTVAGITSTDCRRLTELTPTPCRRTST